MTTYDIGDLARVTGTFADGTVDPTTVTAKVRAPNGTVTTYVYLTHDELVRGSTGVYHVDVNLTAAGTWRVRFESTGMGQAAEEHRLNVRRRKVS